MGYTEHLEINRAFPVPEILNDAQHLGAGQLPRFRLEFFSSHAE